MYCRMLSSIPGLYTPDTCSNSPPPNCDKNVSMCMCSAVSNSLWPHELLCPPGSSVHGNFQAKILEWVDIFSSRGSFPYRDWTHISCVSCIGRWILHYCSTREAKKMSPDIAKCPPRGEDTTSCWEPLGCMVWIYPWNLKYNSKLVHKIRIILDFWLIVVAPKDDLGVGASSIISWWDGSWKEVSACFGNKRPRLEITLEFSVGND